MKIVKKQLVEFVGVAAVVLSVLFLAYELRQSNQIARSSMTFELQNNYAQLNDAIYLNPEFAALRVKARDPNFQPTEVEEERLRAMVRRMFNIWVPIESAYANGHQTRAQLESTLDDVDSVFNDFPGISPMFQKELDNYPGLGRFEIFQHAMNRVEDRK